jgi:hypothetical protein
VYLCCLQQELPAMLEYLGVSKRICLYLARKNAQQTIDHLVYEVSLQLLEDEGPAAGGSSGGTGTGGYQQHRPSVPLEFAAVLQQFAGGCCGLVVKAVQGVGHVVFPWLAFARQGARLSSFSCRDAMCGIDNACQGISGDALWLWQRHCTKLMFSVSINSGHNLGCAVNRN